MRLFASLMMIFALLGCKNNKPIVPPEPQQVDVTIKQYVADTSYDLPEMPYGYSYHTQIDNKGGPEHLLVSCEDFGTVGVDSLQDKYNDLVLASEKWTERDVKLPLSEEIELVYTIGDDSDGILIAFSTFNEVFELYIYVLPLEQFGEVDGVIREYVSSTSYNLPLLPQGNAYTAVEDVDEENYPYLLVECLDNGTFGVDSIAESYNESFKTAEGWISFNSEEYPVNSYGYIYSIGTADKGIDINFFTFNQQFVLYIYVNPCYPVPVDNVNLIISQYISSTTYSLPELPSTHDYYCVNMEEENYLFVYAEDNGTVGSDSLEDVLNSEIVKSGLWTCLNDDGENSYDKAGYLYCIGDEYDGLLIQFFTYEGMFSYYISIGAPTENEDEGVIVGPTSPLQTSYTTSSWNETELVVLNNYLYGLDSIPCLRIEGNSELLYDNESGSLYIDGAHVDTTLIEAYRDAFLASGWNDDTEYQEGQENLVYYFSYDVTVEDVVHTIYADLYAYVNVIEGAGSEYEYEYQEYASDGFFALYIYDPFYYEMPSSVISSLIEVGTFGGETNSIPSIPHLEKCQIDDSLVDFFGIFFLNVYTNTNVTLQQMISDYNAVLESQGYSPLTLVTDEYGTYYASFSSSQLVEINLSTDSGDGYFYFSIYCYVEEEPISEGPTTHLANEGDRYFATVTFTSMNQDDTFSSIGIGEASLSIDQANASNPPTYYDNGTSLRVYGQSEMTISVEDGYYVESIILHTKGVNKMTLNDITVENGNVIIDDAVFKVNPTNGSDDIILTFGNGSGHVKISSIEIVYSVAY